MTGRLHRIERVAPDRQRIAAPHAAHRPRRVDFIARVGKGPIDPVAERLGEPSLEEPPAKALGIILRCLHARDIDVQTAHMHGNALRDHVLEKAGMVEVQMREKHFGARPVDA